MKLEQLVHVVEVANTQSISRAADNLLVSQPGLSASIKQLEHELGSDLFIRTRKGVALTPLGVDFVARAKQILEQVGTLEKICRNGTHTVFQTLSVAAGHYRFIGAVTAMLLNRHKDDGARFVLRNGSRNDCIDWVADGICDLGIVNYNADEEKDFKKLMALKHLQYHDIYETPTKAIIGAGHPLYETDATEIHWKELGKYPLISIDQTNARDYFRSVFLHTSYDNQRIIVTDQAALYEILEFSDGYCVGFASEHMYKNLPRQHKTRELHVVGRKQQYIFRMAWIAPAHIESMPLAKEYLKVVEDVCTRPDFWELHPDLKADADLFGYLNK